MPASPIPPRRRPLAERDRLFDGAALFALKIALGLWLLHRGFSHISDDDFARIVIAQEFVHAPKLDPSGTSWLPFPFWVTGGVMMAFGRSIEVARAVALTMGALGATMVYASLRHVGVARWTALAGTTLGMALPWNAWLGAATVPEGFTGAFTAAAAIGMAPRDEDDGPVGELRPWMALGLLAAAWSRYETWPVCAVVAAAGAYRILRRWQRDRTFSKADLWAFLPALGPLAWMAWNAHAHGDATHFVARVTAYRHAVGAAGAPLGEKLLVYPRALVSEPLVVPLLLLVVIAIASRRDFRARWAPALLAGASVMAFLIYGELKEGAPTHDPERPLVALFWLVAALGPASLAALFALHNKQQASAMPGWGLHGLWMVANVFAVARTLSLDETGISDRHAQLIRGDLLRRQRAESIVLTPCAFEHFALIAAHGAPEIFSVRAPQRDIPASPVQVCPHVAWSIPSSGAR